MRVAGIDGDVLLEDQVDIAGWMVQTGRIPSYLDWDRDRAEEVRAEQAVEGFEGLL